MNSEELARLQINIEKMTTKVKTLPQGEQDKIALAIRDITKLANLYGIHGYIALMLASNYETLGKIPL